MNNFGPYRHSTTPSVAFGCPWCEGYHSGPCPQVKVIEYHPNGTIKKIEYRVQEKAT